MPKRFFRQLKCLLGLGRREFQPRSPTPGTSQTGDWIEGGKETCSQRGMMAIPSARPALMSLTAPVCCTPSHDPGHHDSPRVLIPPDGGTLRQRQRRQTPQMQPYTSDPDSLEPTGLPHPSLCHPRGQISGGLVDAEDARKPTSHISITQHYSLNKAKKHDDSLILGKRNGFREGKHPQGHPASKE